MCNDFDKNLTWIDDVSILQLYLDDNSQRCYERLQWRYRSTGEYDATNAFPIQQILQTEMGGGKEERETRNVWMELLCRLTQTLDWSTNNSQFWRVDLSVALAIGRRPHRLDNVFWFHHDSRRHIQQTSSTKFLWIFANRDFLWWVWFEKVVVVSLEADRCTQPRIPMRLLSTVWYLRTCGKRSVFRGVN